MINNLVSIIFLISVLSLIAGCGENEARFSLVNESGQVISDGSVTVLDQSFEFGKVDAGRTVSGAINIETDSHYVVKINFSNGERLEKEIGYMTRGFDFEDEITVTRGDVIIKNHLVIN